MKLRRTGVAANFADIVKMAITLIKKIFETLLKLKRITNIFQNAIF